MLIVSIHESSKVFFDNVTFRIIWFHNGKLRFEIALINYRTEILGKLCFEVSLITYRTEILRFWKHTFQNVYVSTLYGFVVFVFEEYCFEIVDCGNISINVFIFSGKIVCVALLFLKLYIRDFIRSKKICFGDIAT